MTGSKMAKVTGADSSSGWPRKMDVQPTARPLRIAIVYSRSPLPMRRADQMTVANLISFLAARAHSVDLFALRTGGEVSAAHEAWLRETCTDVHLFQHGRVRAGLGAVWALVTGKPLQVGVFRNSRQERAVKKAVTAENYDIVYTYYLRSAEATKGLRTARRPGATRPATFLALQLSQTLNTRRILQNSANLWTRLLYRVESKRIASYEARVWRHFDRAVLIGAEDEKAINAVCDAQGLEHMSNVVFGAHGTDIDRFRPAPPGEVIATRIVFSGVMRTPTNVQAVLWFVRNVWPSVRNAEANAELLIVGREPSSEIRSLHGSDGINVTGTVDDPGAYIRSAAVCINPMQAGGGMQNKLIEYFASSKAVVATNVANEGIGAPDKCLITANTPREFSDAVIKLLRDTSLRADLGVAARRYVEQHWTWEGHMLQLEAAFFDALDAAT